MYCSSQASSNEKDEIIRPGGGERGNSDDYSYLETQWREDPHG